MPVSPSSRASGGTLGSMVQRARQRTIVLGMVGALTVGGAAAVSCNSLTPQICWPMEGCFSL